MEIDIHSKSQVYDLKSMAYYAQYLSYAIRDLLVAEQNKQLWPDEQQYRSVIGALKKRVELETGQLNAALKSLGTELITIKY